jgi:hypothetical protein
MLHVGALGVVPLSHRVLLQVVRIKARNVATRIDMT